MVGKYGEAGRFPCALRNAFLFVLLQPTHIEWDTVIEDEVVAAMVAVAVVAVASAAVVAVDFAAVAAVAASADEVVTSKWVLRNL